jgi:hypothetical protein
MHLTCPASGILLHFLLRPIRMFHPPILGVFDPLRPTPIVWIFGQPAPLSGGFPPLLAQNFGTVMLAWVTARIRLEPLFAAMTFFPAMLRLHLAFSPAYLTLAPSMRVTIQSKHSNESRCVEPDFLITFCVWRDVTFDFPVLCRFVLVPGGDGLVSNSPMRFCVTGAVRPVENLRESIHSDN